MKKLTVALLTASALLFTGVAFADELPGLTKKDSFRFVIVPKVVHPWFDLVNDGAKHAAAVIEAQTGAKVAIEYSAPQQADVVQQNQILESTIATHPDGIAIDLLDPSGNRAPLEEAIEQGIQVSVFDSVPPEGMELTAIGNDFCEQAEIASERLVKLLNEQGEVAIMMGVPSAPNHAIRADCHKKVFEKYPNIKLVATGIDNDDIETAQKQAAAIMQANPNLKGWVACDAAGPIGIAQAITEAGKAGQVTLVGLDNLPEMLQAIRDGIADSSSSTKPQMQGYWAVMTMWQKALGVETPKTIDTGIAVLTKDNIGE
ncbi:Ribose ABC transporter substrate-binding protein [uncultured Pleomorphomonas sp.]|uniref:Ribose ABC transporter substrate-binding protein n=1 Tax=uncultured Pleomorphomonas sp. TaxID=442121 RepID=A0A212L2U1_9HYPH|nr:substrate-binding domain-containing protein [uncultured Pleomorphomonas sp.]SCM71874.1 Ribose ABC transporter substrate-binding protein [uncultured Pleomorphomonas sp.]